MAVRELPYYSLAYLVLFVFSSYLDRRYVLYATIYSMSFTERKPLQIGKRYGKWIVLSRNQDPANDNLGHPLWLCRCDCGEEKAWTASYLRKVRWQADHYGFPGGCKKCQVKCADGESPNRIQGQIKGTWEVLYRIGTENEGTRSAKSLWRCRCIECGIEKDIVRSTLVSGDMDGKGTGLGCPNCKQQKCELQRDALLGKQIDSLTIAAIDPNPECPGIFHNSDCTCVCVCGNEVSIRLWSLLYSKNYHCCKACRVATRTRSVWERYLTELRRGADGRGIEFNLTVDDLANSYTGLCNLSGVPIDVGSGYNGSRRLNGYRSKTASIDRIDSSKGYTSSNIQWVHKTLNSMKNVLSTDEFIHICSLVAGIGTADISIPDIYALIKSTRKVK